MHESKIDYNRRRTDQTADPPHSFNEPHDMLLNFLIGTHGQKGLEPRWRRNIGVELQAKPTRMERRAGEKKLKRRS